MLEFPDKPLSKVFHQFRRFGFGIIRLHFDV